MVCRQWFMTALAVVFAGVTVFAQVTPVTNGDFSAKDASDTIIKDWGSGANLHRDTVVFQSAPASCKMTSTGGTEVSISEGIYNSNTPVLPSTPIYYKISFKTITPLANITNVDMRMDVGIVANDTLCIDTTFKVIHGADTVDSAVMGYRYDIGTIGWNYYWIGFAKIISLSFESWEQKFPFQHTFAPADTNWFTIEDTIPNLQDVQNPWDGGTFQANLTQRYSKLHIINGQLAVPVTFKVSFTDATVWVDDIQVKALPITNIRPTAHSVATKNLLNNRPVSIYSVNGRLISKAIIGANGPSMAKGCYFINAGASDNRPAKMLMQVK